MARTQPLVLSEPARAPQIVQQQAVGDGIYALSISDPMMVEFLRGGYESTTGATVNVETAMRNTSLFRAVSLISYAIGMLPLQLINEETKEKASGHPLYKLLHREPNNWQTAFDFRSLMQLRALVKGNAYALIVRTSNSRGQFISRLVPLDPDAVTPRQNADWSLSYDYQPQNGGRRTFSASEIFHLRGLSLDGINGLSLVKQARDAIGLALSAELAAGRVFKNGAFVGGMLTVPGKLSLEAHANLRASMAEKQGADNAGKTIIGEEGMDYKQFGQNARDAQMTEIRKMQVEEIARVTGVPRPLLMVDETSWGSGIEALGRFFVQYALGPWFSAWEQAAERSLLTDGEKDTLSVKFNPGALLRGSMKDQSDFFAKALGAGGAPGWMSPNEIRDLQDLPADADPASDVISKGAMGTPPATNDGGDNAPA